MDTGLILPEDLSSRPATMEDVDAVTTLLAACELHDDGVSEVAADDVATDLARPSVDMERDSLLLFDGGTLVAWAGMLGPRRAQADVHPGHRGRGIGTPLLAWTEACAREAGAALVGQTKTDANTDAADLFRRHGYSPRHTSWMLEIGLDEEPPEPSMPGGIRVRDYVPGADDLEVYRLIDDAFNEWPDREPSPFQSWAAFTIRRETFDPRLSPIAVDGDEIVGAALSLDYGDEVEGYVHQVAVRKTHRNRGIARGLLRHAFREFRRKGRRSCCLSTDSRTGALDLYLRVGMSVRRSYTHFAKELRPAG